MTIINIFNDYPVLWFPNSYHPYNSKARIDNKFADLFIVRYSLLLLSFFQTEMVAAVRKISTCSLVHLFQLVIDFISILFHLSCLQVILDTAIFVLPLTRYFEILAIDFPISSSFFSELRLFSELCVQVFLYKYKVLRNLLCF